jgi:type IV secretory pathway TrbD component
MMVPMNQIVPRRVLLLGLPVLAAALGAAIWGWIGFGEGIWFDTLAHRLSLCL